MYLPITSDRPLFKCLNGWHVLNGNPSTRLKVAFRTNQFEVQGEGLWLVSERKEYDRDPNPSDGPI